jgi:hypothetical protein
MRTPVSYVVVPRTEWVVLRVPGHPANKRALVEAVRSGRQVAARVRTAAKVLWSKARVKREYVNA